MFEATTEILEANRKIRYRISVGGRDLLWSDVLELWQTDQVFREEFTSLLTGAEFGGFRWETPALTKQTAKRPFEFVLVNSPGFVERKTDHRSFSEHFTDASKDDGVVHFLNLSGDATLVVPSPRTGDDVYGHLAAFVRGAPESQISSLWRVLGQAVTAHLSEIPIWVSTAGGGVAWLHVRIDRRPKYYSHREYKVA